MMKTKTRLQGGFTIVELLIVIVVIAILAAITVVAYTGVQERARNSVTISAAQEWVKALTVAYQINGQINITMPPGDNSICLGSREQYPAISGGLSEGQCYVFAHTSDDFMDIMNDIASISMTTHVVDDGLHDFRGLQYGHDDESIPGYSSYYIWYTLLGEDRDCTLNSSQVESSQNGITTCRVDMHEVIGDYPVILWEG